MLILVRFRYLFPPQRLLPINCLLWISFVRCLVKEAICCQPLPSYSSPIELVYVYVYFYVSVFVHLYYAFVRLYKQCHSSRSSSASRSSCMRLTSSYIRVRNSFDSIIRLYINLNLCSGHPRVIPHRTNPCILGEGSLSISRQDPCHNEHRSLRIKWINKSHRRICSLRDYAWGTRADVEANLETDDDVENCSPLWSAVFSDFTHDNYLLTKYDIHSTLLYMTMLGVYLGLSSSPKMLKSSVSTLSNIVCVNKLCTSFKSLSIQHMYTT